MNKFLVLLYFFLLFSSSLCELCEDVDCDKSKIEQDQQPNYACVKKDDGTCELKLLCTKATDAKTCSNNYAEGADKICIAKQGASTACVEEYPCKTVPKSTGDETVDCSSYPVSDSNKYSCEKDESSEPEPTYACHEVEYSCKTVPISLKGSIKCSDYSVTPGQEDTHYCEESTDSTKACEEIPYCEENNEGDCTKFKVVPTKSSTHVCVPGETSPEGGATSKYCQEQYLCSGILKDASSTETITCPKYILSEANRGKGTHTCIQDSDPESTKACKEVPFCSHVTSSETDKDCSKYPIENDDKDKACISKEADDTGKICQEKYLCDKVPKGTTEDCKNFALTGDSKYTHECKSISDETYACKSEKYKCSAVPKIKVETSIKCSDFDVDSTKTETHVCIEDTTSSEKQCKEEYLCTKATSGANNEECSKYPVEIDKRTTHGCVKDSTKDQGCKEEQLCDKVTLETPSDTECAKYPVSFDKIQSHICVKNPESTVSSCIEQQLKCESKTSGATDDIREGLSVEKTGEQKCVKDGDKCSLLSYCDYGIGSSDEDCAKFALKDEKKECKKKEGENKCEEVEKKTEPVTPDDGKTDKEEKSDGAKTSDKDESSDAIKDASDTTAAPATKKENENSGNLINVAYSLLLINYLVLLF